MMIHIPDELSSFSLMTISMGLIHYIQCYEIKIRDACDVSWFRQQHQSSSFLCADAATSCCSRLLHCKCANALSVSLLIDRNTSITKSQDGDFLLVMWILGRQQCRSPRFSCWWDIHKNPDRKEGEEKLKAIDALTIISDVVIKVNAIHLLFQIRMNRNRWQMCQSISFASLQAFASFSLLSNILLLLFQILFLKKYFRSRKYILSLPSLALLPFCFALQ